MVWSASADAPSLPDRSGPKRCLCLEPQARDRADVATDVRYLTTIGGTRGEMIQPILDQAGVVVGSIDVESDRVNAFSDRDGERLADSARNLLWLWHASG